MSSDLIVGFSALAVMIFFENILPFKKGRRNKVFHAYTNLFLALINGLVAISFSWLIVFVVSWARQHEFGIVYWFSLSETSALVISFVLYDMWMYWWHRLSHEIWLFWSFHQVHHADTQMDATTAVRFHPIEIILSNILNLGILAIIGMSLDFILFYKSFLFVVIIFHHSNIRLNDQIDQFLKFWIVTPNMHRVHHSLIREETNSNYGSVFSFWDRAFRSFCNRRDVQHIQYGIGQPFDTNGKTIKGILLMPLGANK